MPDLLTIAVATLALAILFISHQLERIIRHMSALTDALAAGIAGLTTSVDALIVATAAPKENPVALQASIDAVVALKGKVDTALAPPAAPAA